MKYIAVFDDAFLFNFRLDDGGLTLVLDDKAVRLVIKILDKYKGEQEHE